MVPVLQLTCQEVYKSNCRVGLLTSTCRINFSIRSKYVNRHNRRNFMLNFGGVGGGGGGAFYRHHPAIIFSDSVMFV